MTLGTAHSIKNCFLLLILLHTSDQSIYNNIKQSELGLHSYNPVCFNLIIILHGNLQLEWFNKNNYINTIYRIYHIQLIH